MPKQRKGPAVAAGSPPQWSPSQEQRIVLVIFFAALAIRLGLLLQMRDSVLAQTPILDGAYYYDWARRIAAGDWAGGSGVFTMSPGYSYLLAVLFKILGPHLPVVAAVQCVVSALSCVLVYRLARHFYSASSSAVAALLLAGYGASVFYANLINKACWIEFLNLACLFAALRAIDSSSSWDWLLPGILLGASAQLRPNILLFLPLLAAAVWLRADAGAQSKRTSEIGALLLGAGLALFPVALRNRVVGGEWVMTTSHGGMNFYTGNNPRSAAPYRPLPFARTDPQYEQEDFFAEAQRRAGKPLTRGGASQFWYRESIDGILQDVPAWFLLMAKKFWLIWSDYEQPINQNYYFYGENFRLLKSLSLIGYWLIAPIGLFGLVLTWRHKALLPLHFYVLAQVLGLLVFFVVSEYRHPLTLALVVYAAGSVEWFREEIRLGNSSWKKPALALGLVTLAAGAARGFAQGSLSYRQDLAVAYGNLGGIYMVKERWNDAIAALRQALSIIPDYAEAHYNLGECYIHLDRPEEAQKYVLEGMRIRPAFVPSHYRSVLAHAYAEQKEWGKATNELEQALRQDPADGENLLNLALVYRQTGRIPQATQTVEKLMSLQPRNKQALILATEMAIAERDRSKIFDLLPRIASASPDDPLVRDLIGRALVIDGHYPEAKAEFERALSLKADFVQARQDLERIDRILSSSGARLPPH